MSHLPSLCDTVKLVFLVCSLFHNLVNLSCENNGRKYAALVYYYSIPKLHGHVIRMPENRLPRKLFYGELVQGPVSYTHLTLPTIYSV